MTQEEKDKLFHELNSVLVKFWVEHNHPSNDVRVELMQRMIHWYANQASITQDKLL